MQHTSFQIDNVNYLLESGCHQVKFPVLVDKVIRHLERIGKKAAAEMHGNEASVRSYTKINHETVMFHLTVNPKGLHVGLERP